MLNAHAKFRVYSDESVRAAAAAQVFQDRASSQSLRYGTQFLLDALTNSKFISHTALTVYFNGSASGSRLQGHAADVLIRSTFQSGFGWRIPGIHCRLGILRSRARWCDS